MGIPSGEMTSGAIKEAMMADLQERVAALRTEQQIIGLDLISANPDHAPSAMYVGMKARAAQSLGIVAHRHEVYSAGDAVDWIVLANDIPESRGIVVQLPLKDCEELQTSSVVNLISPEKDVDGLREDGASDFTPATPMAIVRLLEGHGVDLSEELITVVGLGKLVGRPLAKYLEENGADVTGIDLHTPEETRIEALNDATVIISAMGAPNTLTPDLFTDMSHSRILVDAGTAEQGGKVHGDVTDELREVALANDWAVSAAKGSVGPLTVASLLENVVISAERNLATSS